MAQAATRPSSARKATGARKAPMPNKAAAKKVATASKRATGATAAKTPGGKPTPTTARVARTTSGPMPSPSMRPSRMGDVSRFTWPSSRDASCSPTTGPRVRRPSSRAGG